MHNIFVFINKTETLVIIFLLISDKYTRFCQWKNLELNISVSIRKL